MTSKIYYTKYEYAKVLGARYLQLSSGEHPKISREECAELHFDAMLIGQREMEKNLLELQVKRVLPNGVEKIYDSKDMILRPR